MYSSLHTLYIYYFCVCIYELYVVLDVEKVYLRCKHQTTESNPDNTLLQ